MVNYSENCGLCLSQRHIYVNIVESKVDILTIYNVLYSKYLEEIGLYLLELGCNMTETSNLLTRLKGSEQVYLRHMKNMERSILNEIGTFSCENEEQTTKLIGLENRLLERIDRDSSTSLS